MKVEKVEICKSFEYQYSKKKNLFMKMISYKFSL